MKPGLSLRVAQHLALTPQLQQSIRLLQLSTLELEQEVGQMLDSNPFLERDEGAEAEPDSSGIGAAGQAASDTPELLAEPAWELEPLESPQPPEQLSGQTLAAPDGLEPPATLAEAFAAADRHDAPEPDWNDGADARLQADAAPWDGAAPGSAAAAGSDGADAADWRAAPELLTQHLNRQAAALRLRPEVALALHALIESLDDDGYLADPLDEIAAALQAQTAHRHVALSPSTAHRAPDWLHCLQQALPHLHAMEPTGVGARDLAECLQLQILELRNSPESRAALAICQQPLQWLARRDSRRLAQLCACPEALVRSAFALIARLEPKPARRFAALEPHALRPDVIVSPYGQGFQVQLNPEVQPRLRLHDVYAQALRQGGGSAGLQQQLQEARWFIKNVQQRFDTILRVASAIVERQRNFLRHGALAMRPLVLREIADTLGLHESTISRVTSAKYMATPQGTFEFRYFFGSGLATEGGSAASSTAVRALIQQFVAAEDPRQPLSDNQLAELLQAQGIACARRTVAKYREALRLAPAALRKAL